MLQRLQTALAKVKAYNKSANLLNKIRQIIHSLHDEKKMDTTFMNSENSRTSYPHPSDPLDIK